MSCTEDPCVTITFDHDLPVDAFHPPPAIASHGHKRQQTRRGGMNRRAQASDAASVLTRNEYMDCTSAWSSRVEKQLGGKFPSGPLVHPVWTV